MTSEALVDVQKYRYRATDQCVTLFPQSAIGTTVGVIVCDRVASHQTRPLVPVPQGFAHFAARVMAPMSARVLLPVFHRLSDYRMRCYDEGVLPYRRERINAGAETSVSLRNGRSAYRLGIGVITL